MKQKIVTDMAILKQKSLPATPNEVQAILQDLNDTLDLKRGLGLSAVQIGILKNVAIIRTGNVKLDLINASILDKAEKVRIAGEGCLSLAGIRVDTMRYGRVTIENNGKIEEYSGLLAIAIQHEIDHSRGLTILDRKWKAR
jgi:peptide deformylase